MPIVNQTLTPSFTPPAAAAARLISDTVNSKTKIAALLLPPPAGASPLGSANILRSPSGAGTFAALVGAGTLPLLFTLPLATTGVAWAACPYLATQNLVVNGAALNGHGYTLPAQAVALVDALAASGYAFELVATAAAQQVSQIVAVQPSTAYSFGFAARTDGTMTLRVQISWLDSSQVIIGSVTNGSASAPSSYTDITLLNQSSPANAAFVKIAVDNNAAGIAFVSAFRIFRAATLAAWTAAHQQLMGSQGVSITGAASLQLPLPTGFAVGRCAVVGTYRPNAAQSAGVARSLFYARVDANNSLEVLVDASNNLKAVKTRTSLTAVASDAGATAFAAGDTVAWALFVDPTGVTFLVSKNGAAPTTYTATTLEAKQALTGTPTLFVGSENTGANQNGVTGIVRFFSTSATLAQVTAIVSAPYGDPTDVEMAIWRFEGQAYQVPVVDDRLQKLGASYDYRIDVNSTGTSAATATGAAFTATTPAQATSWWLRSVQDATKDVTLYVLTEHKYKVLRAAQVIEPASGGLPSVIYTGAIEGISGQLTILAAYTTAAAQALMETALRTLLGSNDIVYLLSPFGGLFKVRFPSGVELNLHEQFLDVTLDVVEVA